MDPVSALALLVVKFGVSKVVKAMAGDDAAGLAAGVLGVLTQSEQNQTRLLNIEQQLQSLLENPCTIALGVGTRSLEQAFFPNRDPVRRTRDLERAEEQFLQASHAAKSATQRALVERQLFIARLAQGDELAAEDSARRLDTEVGQAVADTAALYQQPWEAAQRRITDGTHGTLTTWQRLNRLGDADPRWSSAHDAVRQGANETMRDLALLLADSLAAKVLISGTNDPSDSPPSVTLSNDCSLIIGIPPLRPTSIAGVTATLGAEPGAAAPGDTSGYLHHGIWATVELSAARTSVVDCWAGATDKGRHSVMRPAQSDVYSLAPGGRAVVRRDVYCAAGADPSRIFVYAGGLIFAAPRPAGLLGLGALRQIG